MKRSALATVFASAICLSSFAQGNFTFNNSSSSLVWDGRFGNSFKAGATMEVAVMWTTNLSAIPTTYLHGAATPTNGAYQSDWSGIFSDPNFTLALDTTGGNPPIVTTCGGTGPAEGAYAGGISYIFGSSPSQTVQLYVLGWVKSFGTDPVAAALAGSPVGFSSPIQFTLGNSISPGSGLGLAGISGFGISVPEPSSFALAGLALAACLIRRRRKR